MRRLVLPAVLLAAVYFALFGGEYSVFELREARDALAAERARVAELERQLDSLEAWRDSLLNDPATLERIARERFGMIREGETLYRFAEPEDTAADTVAGGGNE